jgi:hypothetical protein
MVVGKEATTATEKLKTMNYTVTASRIVPMTETVTSMILRKTITNTLANAGHTAVCVRLEDGRTAWGFAPSATAAESAAVTIALAI